MKLSFSGELQRFPGAGVGVSEFIELAASLSPFFKRWLPNRSRVKFLYGALERLPEQLLAEHVPLEPAG